MSSGCGDVLSLADLQTAKKHQIFEAEVITGKSGGVATGADIDYATNQVTGQTQKTLPAVLRDAGFSPVSWDFSTGGTLTVNDRGKVVYDPVSKTWYSYAGTLPVVVPASFNPVGNANWKPQTDPDLRQDLAATTAQKGASLVGYKSPVAGSVATTLQLKEAEYVSIYDFGAKAETGFDNAAAFALVKTAAEAGITILFPAGTYETSSELTFTSAVKLVGMPGTRIKITAPGKAHVMCIDLRGPDGDYWGYGAHLENFILDGNGNAVDGLSLRGVISSRFVNIRATNVTRAGLHRWWTQLCTFENFQCSSNVEAFTTTPVYGILTDCEFDTGNDRGSSADTITNPEIEHVSGTGICGVFESNSVYINGTSEGNNIGIAFGNTDSRNQSVSNTIIGMDLEVNTATDILLHSNTYSNDFIGLKSGYNSPSIQVQGSFGNKWLGGTCAGIDFNSASHDNRVYGVSLLGAGAVITDAGVRNKYTDCFNISTSAISVSTNPYPNRGNNVLAANATATIDPYRDNLTVVTATSSPINIVSSTTPLDGARMDLVIHNATGSDTLVINWSSAFRVAGFTHPAAGRHRGISLVYDANYGYWCVVGMATADAVSV